MCDPQPQFKILLLLAFMWFIFPVYNIISRFEFDAENDYAGGD